MNNVLMKIDHVTKSYLPGGRRLTVLNDVSLEIMAGEMVAITGPSGIGKTTLLHILGTLDRPDSGTIVFRDIMLDEMNGESLARFRNKTIGFVFQFFQLLPEFTALENVAMPLLINGQDKKEAFESASAMLKEVGLADRLTHSPSQLSGGEQQRAAIARALVTGPELLLADEPTGNLDTVTGGEVFSLLRGLQKDRGLTSIIVTHNPEISRQCDRVIALEEINVLES